MFRHLSSDLVYKYSMTTIPLQPNLSLHCPERRRYKNLVIGQELKLGQGFTSASTFDQSVPLRTPCTRLSTVMILKQYLFVQKLSTQQHTNKIIKMLVLLYDILLWSCYQGYVIFCISLETCSLHNVNPWVAKQCFPLSLLNYQIFNLLFAP